MECRGCGKSLDGIEYKMVAQWPFCLDCFTGLLEKSKEGEGGRKMDGDDEGEAAIAPSHPEDAEVCSLCGKKLLMNQGKKLAFWRFCDDCYGDLNAGPKVANSSRASNDGPSDDKAPAVIEVEPIKFVNCASCGRRIPEKGSKEQEGGLYCPDCFLKLYGPGKNGYAQTNPAVSATEAKNGMIPTACASIGIESRVRHGTLSANTEAAKVEEVSLETSGPSAAASEICASCSRRCPGSELSEVEGFVICRACLSTDKEMALHIAKRRHKERLQRIKDELG